MLSIHDGQCGLCAHFGEHADADKPTIVQVRINGQAPEDMLEPCGLPANADRHLKVSPIGGCDGYTPAKSA